MSAACIPAERKIDYLRFTLSEFTSPESVMQLFDHLKFKERGFGLYRYKQSAVSEDGTVMILWDGSVVGMGVHVQISGQGCRLVESRPDFPGWQEWIKSWIERKASFARVDIAVDDVSGGIAFQTVLDQVKSGTAVMRASSFKVIADTNLRGARKGTCQTLYVGQRASQTLMRCYDKGMQLGEGRSWLRFEFEYKGKRADALARLFVNKGWDAAVGCARSFIEFKDEAHHTSDRTRQRPAAWWLALIDASKHVLHIAREAHASLVRSWVWLRRQVAPILGVMLEHEQGDLTWAVDLADEGKRRWHERHLQMLRGDGELPVLAGAC